MDDTPPTNNIGLADAKGVTLAGKIMVGTIITLFFVVVVILGIHIYARLYIWRRSGGRRRRFEFNPAEGMVANEGLKKGVDPEVLKSLPVVVFSGAEFESGLECAVCLSEVVDGEKARILPNCSHGFHVGCIDMWLQSHSTCPLCRSPVGPPQASENDRVTSESNVSSDNGAVNFPTNVLFWGNDVQVSARVVSPEVGTSNVSLVIDIPRNDVCDTCSSSSGIRHHEQDELRSPLSARIRSLTRLWSLNKSVAPSSSSTTTNMEQGDERV